MIYAGLACAVAPAGVFSVSMRGKLGGNRFRVFVATAGPLGLLPRRWRGRAATAVTVAESATVTALVAGGVLAVLGAGRAVLLLALAVAGPLAAGGDGYAAPGVVSAVVAGAAVAAFLVFFDDLVALFSIAPPRDAVGNVARR